MTPLQEIFGRNIQNIRQDNKSCNPVKFEYKHMHHNRFFGEFDFKGSQITVFDRELVRQVTLVLRLKETDPIVLCDGNMNEAQTRVISISKDSIKSTSCSTNYGAI